MQVRRIALAFAVACISSVAGFALAATPKPKDHLTFTYVLDSAGRSFSLTKKGKKGPKTIASTFGPTFLETHFDASTKTQQDTFVLAYARLDLATLSYPYELSSAQVAGGFYDLETKNGAGQSNTVLGNWREVAGNRMIVVFDSYDAKKRKLTGSFHVTLADNLAGTPNGDLEIADGQFLITIPKLLTK